eukprot:125318-Alexandrium_andersonii.AAC.1
MTSAPVSLPLSETTMLAPPTLMHSRPALSCASALKAVVLAAFVRWAVRMSNLSVSRSAAAASAVL